MAITVFFALRNAVEAARSDAGEAGWYPMGMSFAYRLIGIISSLKCINLINHRWTGNYRKVAKDDASEARNV